MSPLEYLSNRIGRFLGSGGATLGRRGALDPPKFLKQTNISTIISQNKKTKKKKKVSSFSSTAASLLESHSNLPKAIEQHTHDATVATITSESSRLSQSLAS